MSGYKNFAVAGTGEIGTPIIEQLLARRSEGEVSSVTVLSRHVRGRSLPRGITANPYWL